MMLTRRGFLAGLASLPLVWQERGKKRGHRMANGFLVGLDHYWSAVGNAFVDRHGGATYNFTNHGGGVTFADDATWATGRKAICPGDATSWLELARTFAQTSLHLADPPWTMLIGVKVLSNTGTGYQALVDWGNEAYYECSGDPLHWPGPAPLVGSLPTGHHMISETYDVGGDYSETLDGVVYDAGNNPNASATDEVAITIGDEWDAADPGHIEVAFLVKWGRALSTDQIVTFWNGGTGTDYASFDDGSGGGGGSIVRASRLSLALGLGV